LFPGEESVRRFITFGLVAVGLAMAIDGQAQTSSQSTLRTRARVPYGIGFEHMRSEQWEKAAAAFRQAVDIDNEFELAYYMLGRANMPLKQYVAASMAFLKCKELYLAQAGKRFSNAQEAQRYRNDRLTELDELIRQAQSGPATTRSAEQLRQLQEQRRQLQDLVSRGNNMTITTGVPAWVSLSLGSAYFRSGKLADAEREYKEAIATDGRSGEALSNLAVVYLETGRVAEADASIKAAKKAGFKVNPQLEEDIKERLKHRS
jgi:tetratricopeptide (TPR) repeat protein